MIEGLWTSNQKVIGLIPVGSIRIYYCAACGPIKKWVASMSKKDKMADRSPRRHCLSYSPNSGTDFSVKGVTAFLPWFSIHWKPKRVVFFIVHTRYRKSYKLSVENILNHCSWKHAESCFSSLRCHWITEETSLSNWAGLFERWIALCAG